MGFEVKLTEGIEFLEKKWVTPSGLIFACLFMSLLEATILKLYDIKFEFLLYAWVGTVSLISLVWFYSRRYPRAPKNRVGFAVSIFSADDKDAKKLREDFILPLRRLVKSGTSGSLLSFIEVPSFLAEKVVDIDQAQILRIKTRAKFVVYGDVRRRTINGTEIHVLNLNGIVSHSPISEKVKSSFSEEFSEIFPKQVHITAENDFLEFEITSELIDFTAKYIIGIATAMYGDLDYAEKLYLDASERLSLSRSKFPAYNKLKDRLPLRISEIYEARARIASDRWQETRDPAYVEEMEENVNKIKETCKVRSGFPSVLNFQAIIYFLKYSDPDKAIETLKAVNNKDNSVWHFNVAFLYGYKGDLKNSTRFYRKSTRFEIDPKTLVIIEDFICWVLENDSDRYQLHYCLGFINWTLKGDTQMAITDFEKFLGSGSDIEYSKERKLAARWLSELKS